MVGDDIRMYQPIDSVIQNPAGSQGMDAPWLAAAAGCGVGVPLQGDSDRNLFAAVRENRLQAILLTAAKSADCFCGDSIGKPSFLCIVIVPPSAAFRQKVIHGIVHIDI